ncbi:hypothetical protein F0562_015087 [Nyssa sinensis]|uniref:Uncharacterized protein n=1 Tax=Nyssa sinensis TaxID=561372 RepID=A0A5J4ZG23_9ASTE|nr:hypothetical protein F0562_015087 [Nyssa sinensis]
MHQILGVSLELVLNLLSIYDVEKQLWSSSWNSQFMKFSENLCFKEYCTVSDSWMTITKSHAREWVVLVQKDLIRGLPVGSMLNVSSKLISYMCPSKSFTLHGAFLAPVRIYRGWCLLKTYYLMDICFGIVRQEFKASMGLLLRSLVMLPFFICFVCLPKLRAQSPGSSPAARALDTLLQDYAYRAFDRPKTGIIYDGNVTSNLTGIKISAMRLRSGSLRKRGVPQYKEFQIPAGVVEQPYVERLVLVYQNLGNLSTVYYPLSGHMYLAPVLGLLAYDASNLSAKNLPELDIRASGGPISINFSDVKSEPYGSVAKCVWFNSDGLVNFSNVISGNVCSTIKQGHFSIVVESTAPSPQPVSPAPPGGTPSGGPTGRREKKNNNKVWIIVGSVLGGLALLVLLGFLALWVLGYKRRKKMKQMEKAAEVGEALHMTSIGSTKAPAAMVTRTQPTLEMEYVP